MLEKTKNMRVLGIIALVGLSAQLSHAAIVACGTGNSTNLGTGTTTGINGTTGVGNASGNNPVNGCAVTDLGFKTFAVNVKAGDGTFNGPAEGNITLSSTGGAITGGDAISNIGLSFAAAFDSTSSTGARTLNETISYLVAAGLQDPPTTPATDHWAMTGVTALSIAGSTISGFTIPTGASAPSITVTEVICLGQTSIVGCTAANEATLSLAVTYTGNGTSHTLTTGTPTATCGSVTAGFGCAISAGGITFNPLISVAIIDTVVINHPASGGLNYDLSFTGFTDPIVQSEFTPEPSTFILLGSALAALGGLHLRKRKQV
jgi:hypothetical protein